MRCSDMMDVHGKVNSANLAENVNVTRNISNKPNKHKNTQMELLCKSTFLYYDILCYTYFVWKFNEFLIKCSVVRE